MFKNKQEREEFLTDDANWQLLYVKSALCHRVMQLKIKEFTIIRIDMLSDYERVYKTCSYFIVKNRKIFRPAGFFGTWMSISQLVNWLKDVEEDNNEKT